ncbi:MAG: iron-sulfur cluster carrier protein ApbC [Pseudomonadales bacterium]|nr:iron-sulfur cluster carrier protein ApbC [Pseudomonadales bacterium]
MNRLDIEKHLQGWLDINLGVDWLTAGCVRQITIQQGEAYIDIVLPYPFASVAAELAASVQEHLADNGISSHLKLTLQVPHMRTRPGMAALQGVKNILAVASGKGGVGKSTTAINLAHALSAEGARVGILDADIYGPSLPTLMGIAAGTRPEVVDEKHFKPLHCHGLDVMSMGFLVTEQTPVVWRGPMATGALMQMLTQTLWSDLDYLIVDMPPGTGDIALTLAQKVPVTAALIVTTPQDLALIDAIKAVEMFNKVEIPVLGVIENMSTHICSHCGHEDAIFGHGAGERLASDYAVDLLASLPLDGRIRLAADRGQGWLQDAHMHDWSERYRTLARKVGVALARGDALPDNRIPTLVMN